MKKDTPKAEEKAPEPKVEDKKVELEANNEKGELPTSTKLKRSTRRINRNFVFDDETQ